MFALIRKIQPIEPIKLNEDKSNISQFFKPVSDAENQTFCLNYGGYPRNDINKFLEAEDIKTAEALSAALIEQPSYSHLEKDVSDAELLVAAKSKYCQTASEIISYNERMLEIRDKRLLENQQKIDEEKSAAEKQALRKALHDSLTNEERDIYLKAKRNKEIQTLIDSE